ncbi:hypothetical protein [Sulfobacillus thermosulfidooxidans]|uniref:hypothetical protein n=1 Tax=Sulfobacillus thermosulfidooxidans TaxID=28034 RepID=UPI0006B59797|nr:hypothetical protein [Sulfobacillus thermosulfidooxidans]
MLNHFENLFNLMISLETHPNEEAQGGRANEIADSGVFSWLSVENDETCSVIMIKRRWIKLEMKEGQ